MADPLEKQRWRDRSAEAEHSGPVRISLKERVLRVLNRYMSPITAQSVLFRASRQAGTTLENLDATKAGGLFPALAGGIRLFVDESERASALSELREVIADRSPGPSPEDIPIHMESDIVSARSAARHLCLGLEANQLQVQRAATIVSELARNILLYVGEGVIRLVPAVEPYRHFTIRAIDQGPGIAEIDEIMAGRYRSKTGMGMGLLGTKRLADRFDVQTGAEGTIIEAEVRL